MKTNDLTNFKPSIYEQREKRGFCTKKLQFGMINQCFLQHYFYTCSKTESLDKSYGWKMLRTSALNINNNKHIYFDLKRNHNYVG